MGSTVGNQNPWAPYESFRDCSQGICSIYCPQWCYVVFPPPPPLDLDDDSGTTFSPLIIAIIGILASAFLLVSYYTIFTKYCKRRGGRNSSAGMEAHRDEITNDQWQNAAAAGLDEVLIRSITVCKYQKGDGLIEGTECAVCLNEFQENENLRLLPKCTHAFHLPCIDAWLKTHSNCPLCRSSATPASPPPPPPPPPPAPNPQSSTALNISSLEFQRQNDLVLVIEDRERSTRGEVVVSGLVTDAEMGRNADLGTDQERLKHFRRSISIGAFSSEPHLLVADILKIEEDYVLEGRNHRFPVGTIGSSEAPLSEMNRSVSSTGRSKATHHDRVSN